MTGIHCSQRACSVQFSPMTDWGRFSRDPLPVLSAKRHREQHWRKQGCPLFYIVHPAFLCQPRRSLTVQVALKDEFVEAIVARDLPEPCEFLSLDSRRTRLLWAHKVVDLAPYPVVGLVLQVGDGGKFPQALGLKGPDPFHWVSERVWSTSIKKRKKANEWLTVERYVFVRREATRSTSVIQELWGLDLSVSEQMADKASPCYWKRADKKF